MHTLWTVLPSISLRRSKLHVPRMPAAINSADLHDSMTTDTPVAESQCI
jgi:hypothetical protein